MMNPPRRQSVRARNQNTPLKRLKLTLKLLKHLLILLRSHRRSHRPKISLFLSQTRQTLPLRVSRPTLPIRKILRRASQLRKTPYSGPEIQITSIPGRARYRSFSLLTRWV